EPVLPDPGQPAGGARRAGGDLRAGDARRHSFGRHPGEGIFTRRMSGQAGMTIASHGTSRFPHNAGMTEDRIIAADATREDDAVEASIRPKRLDDYLGQRPVREQLSIYIEAARGRGE